MFFRWTAIILRIRYFSRIRPFLFAVSCEDIREIWSCKWKTIDLVLFVSIELVHKLEFLIYPRLSISEKLEVSLDFLVPEYKSDFVKIYEFVRKFWSSPIILFVVEKGWYKILQWFQE